VILGDGVGKRRAGLFALSPLLNQKPVRCQLMGFPASDARDVSSVDFSCDDRAIVSFSLERGC